MLRKRHLVREPFALLASALVVSLTAGSSSAQPLRWIQKPFQTARFGAASAYDSVRQRAVVFGGVLDVNFTLSHETWEWDGGRWTLREVAARPTFTFGTAMAYDSVRERTVLYQPGLRETWEWDGHDWARRSPANDPGPNARYAPMTFDESSQRILLFHPATAVLWAWDGLDWTPISSSGPPSQPSVMVFDPLRQRTTLLNFAGETWDWDGSTWTLRSATGPNIVSDTRAAFDRARGRVVVRVLQNSYGFTETWEWDGQAWTFRRAAGSSVSEAMWYDEVRGRVVIFGGAIVAIEFVPPDDDMYEWDGSQWSRIGPALRPSAGHAMAYDAARQRVVMVGVSGTAEWDGASWSVRSALTAPPAQTDLALAYDVARRTTVLFGGQVGYSNTALGETWEWDGVSWTQRLPNHSPPPLMRHAMAYDPARGRVVLFGGTSQFAARNETWEWDGVDWTQRTPANNPPPRVGAAMVYDAARQRVVLVGGYSGAVVWEWDGVDWTRITPASGPAARSFHALAYDSDRQRVVVFGGSGFADTWEWDGGQWTLLNLPSSPSRRTAAMAYHAATKRMVLYGGDRATGYSNTREPGDDTWVFGPTVRAESVEYANACPGTRGSPRLGALGRPTFSTEPLQLELLQVLPGAPSVLLLSAGSASTPLGGGCELAVATPMVAVSTAATAAGLARFGLLIPVDDTLTGVSVYGQAVVVDPQGAWLQLAFSRGLRLVIGD